MYTIARIKALERSKKGVTDMATNKKSKTASVKSPGKTAKASAAMKPAAKGLPKKAVSARRPSPEKSSRTPVKALKKAAPAATPKKAAKPAAPAPTVKKNAPSIIARIKDLSKKPVKTAPAPKAVSKPLTKDAAKPAAAAEPKKPRFSKVDLDQFKIDLLAMRDRITGQSGSMRNDALQRTDEINPEEDGTDAFMRLQTLEQVSSQQQIITNIDESLRSIEKGSYGVCDNCGELINKPRLAVLPFAKHCIKCQSEMERVRRPGGRR